MIKETALAFVDAINAHNVDKIVALMADGHAFIDAYGNSATKEEMQQGWLGYFSWFPDYLIEVNEVLALDDTVVLLGYAGGTYLGSTTPNNENRWRIPSAWRVVVENGMIKIWQVYADSKIPFDIMNDVDKNNVESKKLYSAFDA